jgi:hypothetical protein
MAAELERHLADENREVSAGALSAYMRKLFRDDYIREMARIKAFLAIDPRTEATALASIPGSGRDAGADDPDRAALEKTNVSPSLFLAAGYDASPDLVIELSASDAVADGCSAEALLSAADVMEESPREHDKPAPFDDGSTNGNGDEPTGPTPLVTGASPTEGALWDSGVSTEELMSPVDGALGPIEEKTKTGETEVPQHLASDAELSGKTVELSVKSLLSDPELAAIAERHLSVDERDGGEARRMPTPTPTSDREPQDTDSPTTPGLSAASDFEIVEASRVASLKDLDLAQSKTTTGIREVDNPGSTPAIGMSPGDFDDVKTVAKPADRSVEAALTTRALNTPSGRHEAKPRSQQPADEQPALAPVSATSEVLRRRGRLLTDVEIAMLILAAAIGMIAVVGTYLYASSMPIERAHSVMVPAPVPAPSPGTPETGVPKHR